MALNNPSSGFFSVTEYQSSPLPWVITGSTSGTDVIKYSFHKVTKNLIVVNNTNGKSLRLGFTLNGINGVEDNYYLLIAGNSQMTIDARVKEVYVRADTSNTISFSLYAGLTTIDSGQMPPLSGSLADGSHGWAGVG
jgi:hypothetical protein